MVPGSSEVRPLRIAKSKPGVSDTETDSNNRIVMDATARAKTKGLRSFWSDLDKNSGDEKSPPTPNRSPVFRSPPIASPSTASSSRFASNIFVKSDAKLSPPRPDERDSKTNSVRDSVRDSKRDSVHSVAPLSPAPKSKVPKPSAAPRTLPEPLALSLSPERPDSLTTSISTPAIAATAGSEIHRKSSLARHGSLSRLRGPRNPDGSSPSKLKKVVTFDHDAEVIQYEATTPDLSSETQSFDMDYEEDDDVPVIEPEPSLLRSPVLQQYPGPSTATATALPPLHGSRPLPTIPHHASSPALHISIDVPKTPYASQSLDSLSPAALRNDTHLDPSSLPNPLHSPAISDIVSPAIPDEPLHVRPAEISLEERLELIMDRNDDSTQGPTVAPHRAAPATSKEILKQGLGHAHSSSISSIMSDGSSVDYHLGDDDTPTGLSRKESLLDSQRKLATTHHLPADPYEYAYAAEPSSAQLQRSLSQKRRALTKVLEDQSKGRVSVIQEGIDEEPEDDEEADVQTPSQEPQEPEHTTQTESALPPLRTYEIPEAPRSLPQMDPIAPFMDLPEIEHSSPLIINTPKESSDTFSKDTEASTDNKVTTDIEATKAIVTPSTLPEKETVMDKIEAAKPHSEQPIGVSTSDKIVEPIAPAIHMSVADTERSTLVSTVAREIEPSTEPARKVEPAVISEPEIVVPTEANVHDGKIMPLAVISAAPIAETTKTAETTRSVVDPTPSKEVASEPSVEAEPIERSVPESDASVGNHADAVMTPKLAVELPATPHDLAESDTSVEEDGVISSPDADASAPDEPVGDVLDLGIPQSAPVSSAEVLSPQLEAVPTPVPLPQVFGTSPMFTDQMFSTIDDVIRTPQIGTEPVTESASERPKELDELPFETHNGNSSPVSTRSEFEVALDEAAANSSLELEAPVQPVEEKEPQLNEDVPSSISQGVSDNLGFTSIADEFASEFSELLEIVDKETQQLSIPKAREADGELGGATIRSSSGSKNKARPSLTPIDVARISRTRSTSRHSQHSSEDSHIYRELSRTPVPLLELSDQNIQNQQPLFDDLDDEFDKVLDVKKRGYKLHETESVVVATSDRRVSSGKRRVSGPVKRLTPAIVRPPILETHTESAAPEIELAAPVLKAPHIETGHEMPKHERGRLFIRLMSFNHVSLPSIDSKRATFSVTLDNGIHCISTDFTTLRQSTSLDEEFELTVGDDLEFILTFKTKWQKRTVPTRKVVPAPSPVTAPMAESRPKSGISKFLSSKRNVSRIVSPVPAIELPKPAPSQPDNDRWDSLVAGDGSFARAFIDFAQYEEKIFGSPEVFELKCYNEWARKGKSKVQPYEIGSLKVQLMFVPRASARETLPSSISDAVEALKNAGRKEQIHFEGFLSQQGGDCKYWRRRFFVLDGSTLTAHSESSRKPRAVINLAKANEVVVDKSSLADPFVVVGSSRRKSAFAETGAAYIDEGFRVSFANGESIDFYADGSREKRQWIQHIDQAITQTSTPPSWTDLVL